MTTQVLLDLPDPVYERAQRLAQRRRQGVAALLGEVLDHGLARIGADDELEEWRPANAVVEREMRAYVALHPQLKTKFLAACRRELADKQKI
jgi:hypothetical protein